MSTTFKDNLTPTMRAMVTRALATKPLQGAAYERLLEKLPDGAGRRSARSPAGKATCSLPDDYLTQKPFVDHTPRHWRWVSISESNGNFNVVHQISRIQYLPGDKRILGIPTIVTEGLTLAEALATGAVVEDAELRLNK